MWKLGEDLTLAGDGVEAPEEEGPSMGERLLSLLIFLSSLFVAVVTVVAVHRQLPMNRKSNFLSLSGYF